MISLILYILLFHKILYIMSIIYLKAFLISLTTTFRISVDFFSSYYIRCFSS